MSREVSRRTFLRASLAGSVAKNILAAIGTGKEC